MALFNRPRKNTIHEYIMTDVYIDAVRMVMGSIDLDPFSSDIAQEFIQAKKYLTPEDDSFNPEEPWKGNVYVYPPSGTYVYNKSEQKWYFDEKYGPTMMGGIALAFKILFKYYCQGHVNQAIFMTNSFDTLSRQQNLFRFPICISRDPTYVTKRDDEGLSPHRTNAFLSVYLPPKENYEEGIERFRDIYSCFGHVIIQDPRYPFSRFVPGVNSRDNIERFRN